MREVGAAALLLALLLGSGCSGKTEGGDDDDTATGTAGTTSKPKPPQPSPPAQCRAYANTWCSKGFGCYVQVGRLDAGLLQANVNQCVKTIDDRLPCSAVMSVGADYDKCISQIKAMPCSKWDVPQEQLGKIVAPSVCGEVLSF
jgi:hypothetical protein